MAGEDFCPYDKNSRHRLVLCLLFYQGINSVFSLVPVLHNSPTNDTVEVGIYHAHNCPNGYFRVQTNNTNTYKRATDSTPWPICKMCSSCKTGELELKQCTIDHNRECGCSDELKYDPDIKHCIPTREVNWTVEDYNKWQESMNSSPPTSQRTEINLTTKVSKDTAMMSNSLVQDPKSQVEHAIKPDWTDFYILTVSSTAVLFFTLSLVLLFLMAVMKARSWYLYRRLPGSGITLCFRGWLSRVRQRDRSTDPIQQISMAGRNVSEQGTTARDAENKEDDEGRAEPIMMTSSPTDEKEETLTKLLSPNISLQNSKVIEHIRDINVVICCADLHFTFPQKKTYVSSCITSEADVLDTRKQGSCPNFILQACHSTVNLVLGQQSHKCCRHRNKLTLNSSDKCLLGQFEAATMELQGWNAGKTKSASLNATETYSSVKEDPCQHDQTACINPDDILKLYMEIAAPFKECSDLKFKGSLQLYLRKASSSHHHPIQENVKLKYNGKNDVEYDSEDSDVKEALLMQRDDSTERSGMCGISEVRLLHSNSVECLSRGYFQLDSQRDVGSSPCLCNQQNAIESRHCSAKLDVQCGDDLPNCIPIEQPSLQEIEVISQNSVEVVVDVHSGENTQLDEIELLIPPRSKGGGGKNVSVVTSV